MSFKPITVTQLNTYIKQIFDAEELLHGISVVGEISGWSNVRGTAYFTLKDESSALSCVCFSASNFENFKNGDSVMVIGSPKYYNKIGKLNFNVVKIEPYGESVLYQKFLDLKQKLEDAGYFKEEIKKKPPLQIKRIGVVSSEEGAVIRDIINVRTRRNPGIDIVLYPVKVQGAGAEYEIAKGIEILDNWNVDVIIVARGGGSFEDLQPFNTEIVANATYNCKKFIMSAVGHETDFTIIDFCSDLRAPTPSAAAELLCDDLTVKKDKYTQLKQNLNKEIDSFLEKNNEILRCYSKDLLDETQSYFQEQNLLFNQRVQAFDRGITNYANTYQSKLEICNKVLDKLNPAKILRLGYACVRASDGYKNSIKNLDKGEKIDVALFDGLLKCIIEDIEEAKWITKIIWKNWKK